MPRLAKSMQSQVDEAQAVGDFQPLVPGRYIATLKGVEAKNSAAGNPMWVAEFEDLFNLDGQKQPGRQWYNLNLPTSDTPPEGYAKGADKWKQYQGLCAGRIKSFFEAFGFTTDSDTDELTGERVVLRIGVRTIQNGTRAGEQTNSVESVEAVKEEHAAVGAKGDGDAVDEF